MRNLNIPSDIRYPSFDLIRLLLAFEVVFAHVMVSFDNTFNWSGFIRAVPAFLAVSGFLVLKSYEATANWILFFRKRILRVFPALFFSLALSYVLLGSEFLWSSIVIWITGGLVWHPFTNDALWSLAWEELSYVSLVLLWIVGVYKKSVFVWILLIISSAVSWKITSEPVAPLYQILSYLPPAFFAGNLMFIHQDRLRALGGILPWFFLVAICLWSYVPIEGMNGSLAPSLLQAFAVVWAGMAGAQLMPTKIPDISYGMYIYHIPIIHLFLTYKSIYSTDVLVMGVYLCVISISLLSWYLIESPSLRFKLGKISS